jgi:hypothetical protein
MADQHSKSSAPSTVVAATSPQETRHKKMKSMKNLPSSSAVIGLLSVLTASGAEPSPIMTTVSPSPWSPSASFALKESYDDNVFLQGVGPNANRGSFVTTAIPSIGIGYKASPAFGATISYTPEINYFTSDTGEDSVSHRAGVKLGGTVESTVWEVAENFTAIEGSDLGPTYLQPGGAPAGGGPAVRDRRDALIERGLARVKQSFGDWFVRPVVEGYLHDFETQHKTTAGYQNFVNRTDLNGGVDAGWTGIKDTALFAGYRYGVQTEDQLFPNINATYYNNHYNRFLVGVEGNPWDWIKLTASLGPEIRQYDGIVAAGFDRNQVYCYIDTTATITVTKKDTVTLLAKSFEQPGFSGRSAYLDTTLDLAWRHKLTDKLTVGAGVHGYNTDIINPSAVRNDWILTSSGVVSYAFTKQLSTELSYLYDSAMNEEAAYYPGREYSRQCVSLGVKYSFW